MSLDTAPAIVNDRTMVPLRFVSECLGATVEWDAYARAVYITTKTKDVAQFVGKDLVAAGLKDNKGNLIGKSIVPGAPDAQYMFVTTEQLPVKFGDSIVYSIEPDPERIMVRQSTSTRNAMQMLIIQDGIVLGSRNDKVYPANPFTASYYTKSAVDEALGTPRIEIEKVNAFAFKTVKNATHLYLIVKNPLYEGDWSI